VRAAPGNGCRPHVTLASARARGGRLAGRLLPDECGQAVDPDGRVGLPCHDGEAPATYCWASVRPRAGSVSWSGIAAPRDRTAKLHPSSCMSTARSPASKNWNAAVAEHKPWERSSSGIEPTMLTNRSTSAQPASSRSATRLRTAWVTHAPVGCPVTPRMPTRQVAISTGEEHVHLLHEDRVDGEEVHRQDPGHSGAQEPGPGLPRPSWGGVHAHGAQDPREYRTGHGVVSCPSCAPAANGCACAWKYLLLKGSVNATRRRPSGRGAGNAAPQPLVRRPRPRAECPTAPWSPVQATTLAEDRGMAGARRQLTPMPS
jgi:hypothetical protein